MTERHNITLTDEQAQFVHDNSGGGSEFAIATNEAYHFHLNMLDGLEQAVNGGGTSIDEMEQKLLSDL